MQLYKYTQWALWGMEADEQKRLKNQWGYNIGVHDKQYFLDYDTVTQIVEEKRIIVQGRAFVFTDLDPFIGIDLDNCLNGMMPKDWVLPILEMFSGTYIEYSPSLTGLKIYAIGDKLKGKSVSRISSQGEQVECYGKGRFFCFTGEQFPGSHDDVTEQTKAISWLHDNYFKIEQTFEPERVYFSIGDDDLEKRAAEYISKTRPPGERERNKTCFAIAGHIYSFVKSDGETRLPPARLHEIMQDWNRSIPDPMSEYETMRATENAMNKGNLPEKKFGMPVYRQDDGVDLSAIMNQGQNREEEHRRSEKEKRKEEAKKKARAKKKADHSLILEAPGFINDVFQHLQNTCFKQQPMAFIAAAVALQSVLCGRKVYDVFGNTPNIYILSLMESGGGKDYPRDVIKRILQEIGCYEQMGTIEKPKSDTSIATHLSMYQVQLMLIDEFGLWFSYNKAKSVVPHLLGIVDMLLTLFSAGRSIWVGGNYADPKKNTKVFRPHVSIYGTSTPVTLWNSMTGDFALNGLLSRVLLVPGASNPKNGPRLPNDGIPDSIINHGKLWHNPSEGNLAGSKQSDEDDAKLVSYTDEAFEFANRKMDSESNPKRFKSEEERVIASRVAQNMCKLALIYACSKSAESPIVDLEAIKWGYAFADMSRKAMLRGMKQIPEGQYHDKIMKVISLLKNNGRKMLLSIFNRKRKAWPRREREEILDNLRSTGTIAIEGNPPYIRLIRE